MKAVWKFPLVPQTLTRFTAMIPRNAIIVDHDVQGDNFFVWALVDTGDNQDREAYRVHILGTGHPIEDDFLGDHIKSTRINIDSGRTQLVFHFFKILKG